MAHLEIRKPIISEKSVQLGDLNKYIFEVSPRSTKHSVAESVRTTFGVEVVDVNMINLRGKEKRAGRRTYMRPNIRKAIVTLKKGSRIAMFEEGSDK
jgi:large subunit ribosomal protein L23